MEKLYQNKEWLYQKYMVEGLSRKKIAELLDISKENIDYWLKKFNLRDNKIKTFEEALNCFELWGLENLRTLCVDCHKKTETFGAKGKLIL